VPSTEANPPEGFIFQKPDDDYFRWTIIMEGPEGTPYAGGAFVVHATFPQDYP
jgi:ubiquitin-protein ligase